MSVTYLVSGMIRAAIRICANFYSAEMSKNLTFSQFWLIIQHKRLEEHIVSSFKLNIDPLATGSLTVRMSDRERAFINRLAREHSVPANRIVRGIIQKFMHAAEHAERLVARGAKIGEAT